MYQILITIMAFLTGLAVGSFLNCLIYRLETNQTFLKGRSFCPHCHHILTWQDLIPIFSFLILRGKCRYCGKKISWQYPLVELATGIIFVLIFNFQFPIFNQFSISNFQSIFNFQFSDFLYYLLISCFLIVIFIYDLKHYIIPDKFIYPAIALTFLYRLFRILNFNHWNLFRISNFEFRIFQPFLLSAILASSFFLLIILISRGKWMGWGDVKLAFLMGLFLGFPNILVAFFFSFFLGAIIGIGLILAKKKGLNSEVPFGPFLASGTFIALFWGEKIISWYLAFLK